MFEDLISVIIPVYNVKEYLSRCLDSVLSQSYSNIEIILSDDGSEDGSGDICDEYSKKDKRVKVIHEENKGLSEARNRGIRIAKGNYICFIDSDDWVSSNYLLKLYYALIRTSADVSECLFKRTQTSDCVGQESGRIEAFNNEEILSKLCKNNHERHVVAWNKLYKRELFNDIKFPLGKLHEDEFTTYLIFAKCSRVSVIYDELYFYYQNSDSIINKRMSLKRLDSIDGLYARLMFFKDKNMQPHYDCCSSLLFKQFTDYVSISKRRFDNKRAFLKELSKKYKAVKRDISPKQLLFVQKISFRLANLSFCFIRSYNILYKVNSFIRKIGSFLFRNVSNVFNCKKRRDKKAFVLSCKNFLEHTSNKKTALILGAIEYANYGDLAIGETQSAFLKNKFDIFEISQKNTIKYIEIIKKIFDKIDVVFMPGGGNISDIWKYDEDIRRLVIKTFVHKPIIIFPQSYGYTDENSQYRIDGANIYNNHGNVTVFARDNYSYEKFKEMFSKCDVRLAPDTVLLKKPVHHGEGTKTVGLCFRDDKETSIGTLSILISLIKILSTNNIPFKFLSTAEDLYIPLSDRNAAVHKKIQEISNCKFVITDRLHCGIFCMLSNTNCLILNNKNSKIKNFINTWNLSKQLKLLDNSDIITSSFVKEELNSQEYYELDLCKEFAQLQEKIDQYAKI